MMSRGRVYTFYSYKGGVGRTMALANVAVLLAQWGHRVLCVDWDLEAPGLDRYLLGRRGRASTLGLVDYIAAFAVDDAPDWRDYRTIVEPEPGVCLDLIHAGRDDEDFLRRMQAIDWEDLYADKDLGYAIEAMRDQWVDEYDFVLIDSRTGINDVSGICTVQLPDEMVVLFTANSQSFDGVLTVIERAERQRDKLPVDRPRMFIIPLVCRFELRVEYEEARRWLDEFEERLRPHLERWVEPDEVGEVLTYLRIPYVPYWSFGERLAVLKADAGDPDDISYGYRTVAALLVRGLQVFSELRTNREQTLSRARGTPAEPETVIDLLMIGESGDADILADLEHEMRRRGVVTASHLGPEVALDDTLIDQSADYLLVVGPRWHPRRNPVAEKLLEKQANSPTPRRVIALIREPMSKAELPDLVRRMVWLREPRDLLRLADMLQSLLDLGDPGSNNQMASGLAGGDARQDELRRLSDDDLRRSARQAWDEYRRLLATRNPTALWERVESASDRLMETANTAPDGPAPEQTLIHLTRLGRMLAVQADAFSEFREDVEGPSRELEVHIAVARERGDPLLDLLPRTDVQSMVEILSRVRTLDDPPFSSYWSQHISARALADVTREFNQLAKDLGRLRDVLSAYLDETAESTD